MREICHEFLFVEEAAVPLFETVGEIPVEECDHGNDVGGEKVVYKVHVVLESFGVDWVIAASEGDDA